MEHLCGSLGAAWRSHGAPLWLPWGILAASLAQEDFEGKTSKSAEAFIKNWRGGPQNSNASSIFYKKLKNCRFFP